MKTVCGQDVIQLECSAKWGNFFFYKSGEATGLFTFPSVSLPVLADFIASKSRAHSAL